MKATIITLFHTFLATLFGFLYMSCNKEVTPTNINEDYFIRYYSLKNGARIVHMIKPFDDHSKMCLSSGLKISLLHIADDGTFIKEIDLIPKNLQIHGFLNLSDGSTVFSTDSTLYSIDRLGVTKFKTRFNGLFRFSGPVQNNDGSFAVATNRGLVIGGLPDAQCQVYKFSPIGTPEKLQSIIESSLKPGVKIISLGLHQSDTFGNFTFYGTCFPNWKGTFIEKQKAFIAKQKYIGNVLVYNKFVLIDDTSDMEYTNYSVLQLKTSDNSMIVMSTVTDWNGFNKTRLLKVDENLNIVWQKPLRISQEEAYYTGLTECPDRNYLMYGSVGNILYGSDKAVACKVSKSGEVIWSKVFTTPLFSNFFCGIQNQEGSILFAGYTESFGKGLIENSLFLVKTNSLGNLE
jgi:hypothetical protein